jgi:hypothetical protein
MNIAVFIMHFHAFFDIILTLSAMQAPGFKKALVVCFERRRKH